MVTRILDLLKKVPVEQPPNTTLSIVPFFQFLQSKQRESKSGTTSFYNYALEKIQAIPDWDKEIDENNINRFDEIFELIYITFSSPIIGQAEDAWALSAPLSSTLFFGTNGFYDLVCNADGSIKESLVKGKDDSLKIGKERLTIIYSIILERLYNISVTHKNEIIHFIKDAETGLNKYFRLEFNPQFVEVDYINSSPDFDTKKVKLNLNGEIENIEELHKELPLNQFQFKGFSIVHIKDITPEYIVEHIKDIIVEFSSDKRVYEDVTQSLKNLFGDNDIDVNIFPMLSVNGELIRDSFDSIDQFINDQCKQYGFQEEEYKNAVIEYIKNPKLLFYPDIHKIQNDEMDLSLYFREIKIESLCILPIFYNDKMVGVLELFSKKKNKIDKQKINALNPVVPLLGQLFRAIINNFDLIINNLIKKQFTSIQPSVQWRFNEAAWHYLQQKNNNEKPKIEKITFKEVYPFYGSVDVRNSTIQRNEALQKDMNARLEALVVLLNRIKEGHELTVVDELIFKTNNWRSKIKELVNSESESYLLTFLEEEAEPMLEFFKNKNNDLAKPIDQYFISSKPEGEFFLNRGQLEESFQTINATINNNLEIMNNKIQETYPCYFEKYRSDGYEYDIYMGQSISPKQKFNALYLRNLRLWQLSTMATITKQNHELLSVIPKKLQTTQLIFIYHHSIDISFRSDERRFDVEGAYNIRYEMLKKRIDKVHIKNSTERLTQPGKIALVYFQPEDIAEYVSYIEYMQKQEILTDEMEYLDLENLQGVNGLKALRLSVKL